MLKKRIIPLILCKDNNVVKGKQFNNSRIVGTLFQTIKVFNMRDVDELVVLNVKNDRSTFSEEMVKEIAKNSNVPLSIGGGIRTIKQVKSLFKNGVDKIVLNSVLYEKPLLLRECSNLFGSQSITVSIDVKKNNSGDFICYKDCGKINTNIYLTEWLKKVKELGAGEIIINSINFDGLLKGLDIELAKIVSSETDLPVILSGGAGKPNDYFLVFQNSSISGIAAGAIFQFTEHTPRNVKEFLSENKIKVRNSIPLRLISEYNI